MLFWLKLPAVSASPATLPREGRLRYFFAIGDIKLELPLLMLPGMRMGVENENENENENANEVREEEKGIIT